jgi:hypothetical protein
LLHPKRSDPVLTWAKLRRARGAKPSTFGWSFVF